MRLLCKLWLNRRGQDMIEYALMAGFLVVAGVAFMPNIANNISSIFSVVASSLDEASETGH